MESPNLFDFFDVPDFVGLPTEKQEKFFEQFFRQGKKVKLDLEKATLFDGLHHKVRYVAEQHEKVKRMINHEIPYLFEEKVEAKVKNDKGKVFTLKCSLKIPYNKGPGCLVRDLAYIKEFRKELKEFILLEMKLIKQVGILMRNEKMQAMKTRPEILCSLFV